MMLTHTVSHFPNRDTDESMTNGQSQPFQPHLDDLMQALSAMSKDNKYHFRAKIRSLFEKLVRKFGYGMIGLFLSLSFNLSLTLSRIAPFMF